MDTGGDVSTGGNWHISELSSPRELLSQAPAVGDALGCHGDHCSSGPLSAGDGKSACSVVRCTVRKQALCLWSCPSGNMLERGVFHTGGVWGASFG